MNNVTTNLAVPSAAKWGLIFTFFSSLLLSPMFGQNADAVIYSETIGGKGGEPFSEVMNGNLLVGIRVWEGSYAGRRVIRAVQPLFQTQAGIQAGRTYGKPNGQQSTISAKDGYVVGGLIAKGGLRVDGFKVVFMRQTAEVLDVTQSYESEWVGGTGGDAERRIAGTGTSIVGIIGSAGAELDRLGLLMRNGPATASTTVANSQVKLNPAVGAIPQAPPTAAVATTSNSTTPTPALVLAKNWETPMQGGSSTMDDLSRLFGGVSKPALNLQGDPAISVYENVPYLTPIGNALELLRIPNRLTAKVPLASPGLPRNSFFYYSVNGRFEGRFNRMYLVVDGADQLVSVQLVQETPPARKINTPPDLGWHTYNFVNTRTKAMSTLRIEHKLALWSSGKWDDYVRSGAHAPEITKANQGWTVARLDTLLLQPAPKGSGMEPKEEVRWYVPRPIVELILTCAKTGGH